MPRKRLPLSPIPPPYFFSPDLPHLPLHAPAMRAASKPAMLIYSRLKFFSNNIKIFFLLTSLQGVQTRKGSQKFPQVKLWKVINDRYIKISGTLPIHYLLLDPSSPGVCNVGDHPEQVYTAANIFIHSMGVVSLGSFTCMYFFQISLGGGLQRTLNTATPQKILPNTASLQEKSMEHCHRYILFQFDGIKGPHVIILN